MGERETAVVRRGSSAVSVETVVVRGLDKTGPRWHTLFSALRRDRVRGCAGLCPPERVLAHPQRTGGQRIPPRVATPPLRCFLASKGLGCRLFPVGTAHARGELPEPLRMSRPSGHAIGSSCEQATSAVVAPTQAKRWTTPPARSPARLTSPPQTLNQQTDRGARGRTLACATLQFPG